MEQYILKNWDKHKHIILVCVVFLLLAFFMTAVYKSDSKIDKIKDTKLNLLQQSL